MAKGFSLTELLIVIAIIGIMAAIVVPGISNQSLEAREAAVRDNLRLLRGAIELFAACHGGVAPGYPGLDPGGVPTAELFHEQMVTNESYLRKVPANSLSGRTTIRVIPNGQVFPAEGTGEYGWIYQPATKIIHPDWPGVDRNGIRYVDY